MPASVHDTLYTLQLHFLDHCVTLRSDSRRHIERFAEMYPRFRVDAPGKGAGSHLDVIVLTTADTQWGQPVLCFDEEVWPIEDPALLDTFGYDLILNALIARIRSHFLIHAGVVAWHDNGVLLAADPQHGKTTLTLECVRRGFTFLSDEIAAISRADHTVSPFPRTLRVRPETLDLVDVPIRSDDAETWLGKLLLDIEDVRPGSVGGTVPLRQVIVLQDPSTAEPSPSTQFGLLVDRVSETFLASLQQLSMVTDVRVSYASDYPFLTVMSERGTAILPALEMLCREFDILILDVLRRPERRASFDGPVRCEPISTSDAAIALMQQFQAGHRSVILRRDHAGSPVTLFMELVACIEQATCYRLTLGPLQDMADHVCDLVT